MANENIKVVTERYRQGLSIYTEVLDAENRRVQSLKTITRRPTIRPGFGDVPAPSRRGRPQAGGPTEIGQELMRSHNSFPNR